MPEKEICNQCGKSVAPGSGRFVNRVQNLDDEETRREAGYPFPEGDFTCAECDAKHRTLKCEGCGATQFKLLTLQLINDVSGIAHDDLADRTIESEQYKRLTCAKCGKQVHIK